MLVISMNLFRSGYWVWRMEIVSGRLSFKPKSLNRFLTARKMLNCTTDSCSPTIRESKTIISMVGWLWPTTESSWVFTRLHRRISPPLERQYSALIPWRSSVWLWVPLAGHPPFSAGDRSCLTYPVFALPWVCCSDSRYLSSELYSFSLTINHLFFIFECTPVREFCSLSICFMHIIFVKSALLSDIVARMKSYQLPIWNNNYTFFVLIEPESPTLKSFHATTYVCTAFMEWFGGYAFWLQ